MKPGIVIITQCRRAENFATGTLTFKTINVGFPDWPIFVVDNGSNPLFRPEIRKLAESVGADFVQIESPLPHWQVLEKWMTNEHRSTIFLDPDLIFWSNCEEKVEDYLIFDISGRWLTTHNCCYSRSVTVGRLHTSFLIVSDPQTLLTKASLLYKGVRDPVNVPINFLAPVINYHREQAIFWDTFASLVHALPSEDVGLFDPPMLDCYDHIFCGTCLDTVKKLKVPNTEKLISTHQAAITDPKSLKGLWRSQDLYYLNNATQIEVG